MERTLRLRLVTLVVALGLLAACGGANSEQSDESAHDAPATALAYVAESCGTWPSHNAGPYFLDHGDLVRSGLAEDQDGTPLVVRVTLVGGEDCTAMSDLPVDLWSANAQGLTAGVDNAVFTLDGPNTEGATWLRGRQVTDVDGAVEFTTIWPGATPDGPPHLMLAVEVGDDAWFTTRIILDVDVARSIYTDAAYAEAPAIDDRASFDTRTVVTPVDNGDAWTVDVEIVLDPIEFRPPPTISNAVATLEPTETDALPDAEIVGQRPFEEMPGEVRAMFVDAAEAIDADAEALFDAFAHVTSEAPPDLEAIADSFGVTVEELAEALPVLAGGAPTS